MWEMECSDPIMEEVFLFNSHIAYLYLLQEHIVIKTEGTAIVLRHSLALTFHLERNQTSDVVGLILNDGDMQYHLRKSQWPDADRWETTLMKYIPYADFHQYFESVKELGRGNHAKVFLVKRKDEQDGRHYACKAFSKSAVNVGDGKLCL